METTGGQAQIQILNRFRCGWIKLPAGPVGPPRPAGGRRQAEEEGRRLEESNQWGQGSLKLMGAPAEISRVPGFSLLESVHLYPCSSRTSLKVRLAELRQCVLLPSCAPGACLCTKDMSVCAHDCYMGFPVHRKITLRSLTHWCPEWS